MRSYGDTGFSEEMEIKRRKRGAGRDGGAMKHLGIERWSKSKVCDGKTKSGNWMEQWRKSGRHTNMGQELLTY